MNELGDRMAPDNLYRRIYDEAQRVRRQHDSRLTAQIRRIEEKAARHGEAAQERRTDSNP